jgi:uncharacterized membrane protein
MERIEKIIEVDCSLRAAYDQWTQFESFPLFMDGVKEVTQLDPVHVQWRIEIGGREEHWVAEITEQVPDHRISWRSIGGASNAGTVRFEALSAQRTLVRLVMAYRPEGVVEHIGDAMGVTDAQMSRSLENFKRFMEGRAGATGSWRGTVHGSSAVPEADPSA